MIANETIREVENVFDQLYQDYYALREYTDKLEAFIKSMTFHFRHFGGSADVARIVFNFILQHQQLLELSKVKCLSLGESGFHFYQD